MSMWFLVKTLITAGIIVLVSEVGKTNSYLGSLIASLPMVSYLGMLWMKAEGVSQEKLAEHSVGVFWYVLPSLPFFLLFPYLLKKGIGFFPALLIGTVVMFLLYLLMVRSLARFGIVL